MRHWAKLGPRKRIATSDLLVRDKKFLSRTQAYEYVNEAISAEEYSRYVEEACLLMGLEDLVGV